MPEPETLNGHRSGMALRALAYLIDCACVFLLYAITQFVVFSPLRFAYGIKDDWFRSGWNTELYTLATISLPVWLYFALLESSPWKATVGKRALKLQVVAIKSWSRIRFSAAFCRTVIKLLPWELAHIGNNFPEPVWYDEDPGFRPWFLVSGCLMLGLIVYPFTNTNRQSIHDVFAGTMVVNRNPKRE